MVKLTGVESGISVVINTRNEEKILSWALASVKGWANEIVVVDMESADRSVAIAKKAGAKVFTHKPIDYVEPARNFAVARAKGPWILVLDPDEEVSKSLATKLLELAREGGDNGTTFYRLPRKNIVFGKWLLHSRWWPDYLIRFFKKGAVEWTERIHGIPLTKGSGVDLEGKEELAIIHHHYDTLEKFLLWTNRYADARALSLQKEGYIFVWQDLIRRPAGEFLSRFFFGEGYRDGVHGLALAILQAFAELVVYVKVWEQAGFQDEELSLREVNQEMKDTWRQYRYWEADARIKSGPNVVEGLKLRITRKLSSK